MIHRNAVIVRWLYCKCNCDDHRGFSLLFEFHLCQELIESILHGCVRKEGVALSYTGVSETRALHHVRILLARTSREYNGIRGNLNSAIAFMAILTICTCMHSCTYIYTYIHIYIYMYTYILPE